MKASLVYFLAVPLAFAAPAPAPAPEAAAAPSAPDDSSSQQIHVIWKHHKGSSSKALYAMTSDGTGILGQSCSDKLDTGKFTDTPLTFDVDADGFGELTYGKKYQVVMSANYSGGIECNKVYGPNDAHVDCVVPYSGSTENALPLSEAKDCFPHVNREKRSPNLSIYGKGIHRRAPTKTLADSISLASRQQSCYSYSSTVPVGDGDPHQNYYDQQISENIACGAADQCSAGYENSKSFTVGFSADATLEEWISGGFAVEETWETGNQYTCTGSQGDTVCIWYNTAHTAYTVENSYENTCDGTRQSDPFVLKSPNSNNVGGGYYCVIGTCRSQGAAYWDNSGPAGGPQ